MKPTVKCPECYSTELYKNGKDKKNNQKYLCKKCRRQFTLQSIKKLNNPKCPVCGKDLAILDDTITALYSAWFDIDKDSIMGICTHCGNIQKGKTFTKKIKYIL